MDGMVKDDAVDGLAKGHCVDESLCFRRPRHRGERERVRVATKSVLVRGQIGEWGGWSTPDDACRGVIITCISRCNDVESGQYLDDRQKHARIGEEQT